MAARASTRRSIKMGISQDSPAWATKSSDEAEPIHNDALRKKIERERGSGMLKSKVDEGDFLAVLKKEGVGTNADANLQRSFVEQPAFDIALSSAIILNCIIMGLEIDLAEQSPDYVWTILENVFCITWISEMLLKQYCLRFGYFKDLWNYLDMFLVFLAIYDSWIAPFTASTSDLGYLRVVRMLRLLRLVRLFKVMKMSRNLWLLVQGFIESFSTLCWVSFLILFVIYAYSCLFRILVDCGKDYATWNDCSMLFGTMPKAMFTLFQMLTLESWSMLIARPLIEVNPALLVAIISFLLLTTFGLLNIIVGVVVENTLSVAKQNMDLQTKRAERQLFKELELLRTVFEEADVDGSGTMDKREFCEICNTISVRRALQRMGVPLDQSETLFDIIDSNKTGEVTFPDFVEGVKNVRGVPTNLDMKTMIVAVRNIHKQQTRFEKESVQLQRVLLKFIEEAQEEGNVIQLPPKEELEDLLKVRKGLVSRMATGTFSNYSGNGGNDRNSLREEAARVSEAASSSTQVLAPEVNLQATVEDPPEHPTDGRLPGQPDVAVSSKSSPPDASRPGSSVGESKGGHPSNEPKLQNMLREIDGSDGSESKRAVSPKDLENQPQLDSIPGERRPLILKPQSAKSQSSASGDPGDPGDPGLAAADD